MEARVIQDETERVFPVDPSTHGLGGLAVRQPLTKLHDRHERQPPRALCRPPARREQRAEGLVVVDDAEDIPHLHIDVALRERCARHPRGLLGHRASRLGAE